MRINMFKPKISVIVPIFNVEKYLEETLDSLVNQTFINEIEVLMIDDGSTDNSKYIIEKYALDNDNFYAYHKEHDGVCSTRNFGLNIAKGEYIHFMDADDFIINDAYEKLYKFAKTNNCEVVTSNYIRFDNKKTFKIRISSYVFDEILENIENTNIYEYNRLSWDMPAVNKIIKKKFLENNKITFYKNNIIYEDNLFSIELYSKAKNVGILNEITYCWRVREDGTSITQNLSIDKRKQFKEMVYLVNEFLTKNISDKKILAEKYLKLLTIDLYYSIIVIPQFPEKYQEELFENIYDIVTLVPKEYFKNINFYFKIVYKLVEQKEWNTLKTLINYDFSKKSSETEKIYKKYSHIPSHNKIYQYEILFSIATNINLQNNCIIIDFINYIPFNPQEYENNVYFKLINNNFKDTLDSKYINNTKLYVPLNLLNYGENKLITKYTLGDVKKENYMETEINKIFNFENFNLIIKPNESGHLKIIKREKNNIEVKINEINLDEYYIELKGQSNYKLKNIVITDLYDITKLKYPINYFNSMNSNKFHIKIPYVDLLKAPIKKWIISSDETFNNINLSKDYKFFNEKYTIIIKNYNNYIYIEFKRYNLLESLKKSEKNVKSLIQDNMKLNQLKNELINLQKFNTLQNIPNNLHEFYETIFFDSGTLGEKNDNWYLTNNIIETVYESGTLLTNNQDNTTLYFANRPNSEKRWRNTFNWKSPFVVEIDILDYSNNISFRISDYEKGELTVPFINLGITKNNHVKIINNGVSIEFYIDGIHIINQTIYSTFSNCQIGFRIVNGSLKYKNFKIY